MLTLASCALRARVRLAPPPRDSSLAETVCTLPGTFPASIAAPGKGVVAITSTSGSGVTAGASSAACALAHPASTVRARGARSTEDTGTSLSCRQRFFAVPVGGPLIGSRQLEYGPLGARSADDLHADRQTPGGEAAGNGNGRQPEEVEGPRVVEHPQLEPPGALRVPELTQRVRWYRHGRCEEEIDVRKAARHRVARLIEAAPRLQIRRQGDIAGGAN